MALVKRVVAATTGATHKIEDGTITDLINPTVSLGDSTSNLLRVASYSAISWLARGYKENGSFGFSRPAGQ